MFSIYWNLIINLFRNKILKIIEKQWLIIGNLNFQIYTFIGIDTLIIISANNMLKVNI
jgi:hypothetical protein|tara:strand:+ start:201 stop:374 length:174 start_codon:yes stop_codon:yes gene_type:complete